MTQTVQRASRHLIAETRLPQARAALSRCVLCAHRCEVDRYLGQRGPCRAGPVGQIFSAQVEVSDELELSPCFAIAFSGCDLRCAFCITGAESWNPNAGERLEPSVVAEAVRRSLAQGVRSVMILGGEPTVHLPSVMELVQVLPGHLPLIWKTNAHGTEPARRLLEGLFDIWLVDYKFGNNDCAKELALVPRYVETVQENLLWACRHSQLIIRHLVMPGHLECCWRPVANWIAEQMPEVKVNLRVGFWPAWKCKQHPSLYRTNTPNESAKAMEIARHFKLRLIQ